MAEPNSDSLNRYAAPEVAPETPQQTDDPFLQGDFTFRREFIDCEANIMSFVIFGLVAAASLIAFGNQL